MTALTLAMLWIAAAPAPAPSEADALFAQARALIRAGLPAQACPMLEKSHQLDPALGTLLNLGDCYEATGRLVKAFLSFNEAAAWAARNQEAKRAEVARARASALKGKLSWVALAAAGPTVGLEVTVNGVAVALGAAPQSVPVDAGRVEVVASAAGREPWRVEVSVAPRQTAAVVVPVLVESAARAAEVKRFEATLSPAPMLSLDGPVLPAAERPRPGRAAPAVLMTAGALVGVSGVAGLAYSLTAYGRFQRQQPGGLDADSPSVTRGEVATLRWLYPVSWAAVGVGAAAAVVGAVLFAKEGGPSVAVVPTRDGVAFAATGSF